MNARCFSPKSNGFSSKTVSADNGPGQHRDAGQGLRRFYDGLYEPEGRQGGYPCPPDESDHAAGEGLPSVSQRSGALFPDTDAEKNEIMTVSIFLFLLRKRKEKQHEIKSAGRNIRSQGSLNVFAQGVLAMLSGCMFIPRRRSYAGRGRGRGPSAGR